MTKELKEFAEHLPERREKGEWYDKLAEELSTELSAHADRIEGRLHKFFAKSLIVFAVLGLVSAGSLLGFGVVLKQQKDTTTIIQEQRYGSLLESCLDQNVRHDNVIKSIDDAIKTVPKSKQDPKGNNLFKKILEAAVPYTSDCRVYARERVRGE